MKQKIIFMGTASFSKTVLESLIKNYNVIGVVSQPDRRVGRKKELKITDVKEVALAHNIPVFQPENIKEDYAWIVDKQPDLIITAAYGQIVPKEIIELPPLGCINVHASLLPKYRGGAPVHYAIINGDKQTGVTIMYMAQKMDAGDVIYQKSIDIKDDDNTGILYDKLADLGAMTLLEALPSILDKTNQRVVQDPSKVTFAPTIKREDEKISFDMTNKDLHNRIRGLNPWPGCYCSYKGLNIKIFSGQIHDCPNAATHHKDDKPGTIVKIFKNAIGVKTSDGVYLLTEIQIPGKRKMSVEDCLRGNHIFEENTCFE